MNKFSTLYLNWKVLAALALIGASIWLVAPNVVALVLPLLLVMALPLSILAAILFMRKHEQKRRQRPQTEGPLREEQTASLTAQLRLELSRRETLEQDDTVSHDKWMKL